MLNKSKRIDVRQLNLDDLEDFFIKHLSKKYRGRQVYDWIWKHRLTSFDKITNIPQIDKETLNDNFYINSIDIVSVKKSLDGTIKFLFQLSDNKIIEGVIIPQLNRLTACISSQVGCSLSCEFCATGKLSSFRNLTVGEIYDQVFLINQYCRVHFKKKLTNIVYMGMGEPLLNYKNVLSSIFHITRPGGLHISGKRITLSTAGISKMIKRLADEEPNFKLAISLHSANDAKRSKIMDINQSNNLTSLIESLTYFYNKTKIKPTYEYLLLKGFNDSVEDAKELISFCKKVPSKVNLIEYNKVDGSGFEKSTLSATNIFINTLEKHNILVKIRRSRGEDIGAACGQLATEKIKNDI